MDVEDVPDLIDFVLVGVVAGRVVGVVGVVVGFGVGGGLGGGRSGLLLLLQCCLCVLLSLALVPKLVVDVRVQPSDLVVINQYGDLTFPIT